MVQVSYYDPAERQREKDRARAQDDRDLREGRVSREALRRLNGFFASLDIIDSSIRRRGVIR